MKRYQLLKISFFSIFVVASLAANNGCSSFFGGFAGGMVGSALTQPRQRDVVVVDQGARQPQQPRHDGYYEDLREENRELKRDNRQLKRNVDQMQEKLDRCLKKLDELEERPRRKAKLSFED